MNRKKFKEIIMNERGHGGLVYCSYCGYDDITDWCCAFTVFAMKSIADIEWFPKTISCSALKKSVPQERINHQYSTAEIGDIILFELRNPNDGPDHVGIVVDNDIESGVITLIEGNTGNSNCVYSTVNLYRYSYSNSSFDCIIDMSKEFTDGSASELENKYEKAIKKIKEILKEV